MKTALLVVCLAVIGYGFYDRATLNGRIAVLEQAKARVDSVYVTDTLRLTKVRRITDSILVHQTDTVRLIVARERQACDNAIETCEYRVAYRDSIIGVLKKKPSVWSRLPWILGGVVAGKILLK